MLERRERERHRDPPPGLLGVEVGDGVAVLDPPEAGDRPGGEEQRLGEDGLARSAVADQGHVADLLRRERLRRHRHPQSSASVPRESTQVSVGVYAGPGPGAGRRPGRRVVAVDRPHHAARSRPKDPAHARRTLAREVERGLEPVGQGLHRAGITADVLTIIGLVFAVGTAFLIADGHLRARRVRRDPHRPPRHPRRLGRPPQRPGRPARRVLRLGLRPRRRRRRVRRRRLVPRRRGRVPARCSRSPRSRSRCSSPTSGPGPSALGFTARGGLMERAERLVLLGVGLAFDILVPVLWVMLVLTAITAVQRFVKVWRQATPTRPRRRAAACGSAHRRGPATPGGLATGARCAPRGAGRASPRCRVSRDAAWPPTRRPGAAPHAALSAWPTIQRAPYLAYRAGAEVARVVPDAGRRAARPGRAAGSRSARMPAAGARSQRNLRRVHGGRLRRRRAATRGRRHLRLVRPLLATSCSGCPSDVRGRSIDAHFDVDGLRAHRGRRSPPATGVDPRAAAPRQLGLRRRVARAAGRTRSRSSPSRSSRPSSSSGSPASREALGMDGDPARARRPGRRCSRALRAQPDRVPALRPRPHRRRRRGRVLRRAHHAARRAGACSRCARGAPLVPAGVLLPAAGRAPSAQIGAAGPGRARRAACATTSAASPRTSPTASRSSSASRPSSGTCCSRTGPATAIARCRAAGRPGAGSLA